MGAKSPSTRIGTGRNLEVGAQRSLLTWTQSGQWGREMFVQCRINQKLTVGVQTMDCTPEDLAHALLISRPILGHRL